MLLMMMEVGMLAQVHAQLAIQDHMRMRKIYNY